MRTSFLFAAAWVIIALQPLWGQTSSRGTARSSQSASRSEAARVVAPVTAAEDFNLESDADEPADEVITPPPRKTIRRASTNQYQSEPKSRLAQRPAGDMDIAPPRQAHSPVMDEPIVNHNDGYFHDSYDGDNYGSSCGAGGCSPYDGFFGPGFGRNSACRGPWFGDLEFINWYGKGMSTPPLVSVITNPNANPPTSQVIYPTSDFFTESRPGGRVRLGKWLNCNEQIGLFGEYFSLNDAKSSFIAQSDANGNPQYGRPFLDVDGTPLIEDVSITNELRGSVRVDALSRFSGAGMWLRRNLCCKDISCCDPCGEGSQSIGYQRVDFIAGYRYLRLNERINIHESLVSLLPAPNQGQFEIDDTFKTNNSFHGADFGFQWENYRGRWYLGLLSKLAIGTVHERVQISGQTVTSGANNANDNGTRQGGLLAQTTNIGTYQRNEFAVVPEVGANIGFQLTDRWRLQAGYTLIYWSRVARPGDQIDNTVNQTLIPSRNQAFQGAARPAFNFQANDYWVQGLNAGLHFDF